MKPIEPGCLAILVNAVHEENLGRVVRVNDRAPEWDFLAPSPVWSVTGSPNSLAMEHHLLRIDDYDASADEVEQEREVEHG
jgi:hypothetical protein